MDADVARLVREERLVAAAELASERGDPKTASQLFERACDFRRAAAEAARAGDWARALPLALEGKDDTTAEDALPKLLADPTTTSRVAYLLERRGDHAWSARLLERLGKRAEAARAYERAGNALRAAELLEAEGDVIGAARVLETQARKDPTHAPVQIALGGLLLRYGKTDAAVRALQRVAANAPERRTALAMLVDGFERLGLMQARDEAARELASLGGALEERRGEADGASAAPLAIRARIFGRYEVLRDVASSPSARVLECVDSVRGEHVAVKIFAAYDARGGGRDALARFEREVRVLGTLDHPNIVPLRDYVPEGPALVLAWMSGGTLETMMAAEPLAPGRAVEIAQAVLAALGEAHRLGVIHRDVKPANVLFDDAGVTRLADFGVAHLSDLSATATASVIGTLGYMSPEQREGRPATVKSDLYGVGAMLWEMLTGERPAHAWDDAAPASSPTARPSLSPPADADRGASIVGVRPSAIHRDLDARHDAVVLALLAADPNDRPADAFEARRALGALRWPATIERVAPRPTERPRSEHPVATRLLREPTGGRLDTWLGRRVTCLPLDPTMLARASAFARADHPALQAVLRVDREEHSIWLAEPRGAPLVGRLTAAQASLLRDALERLHALGEVHGRVDPEHVLVDPSGAVTLAFAPTPEATATQDLDRLALARLS